MASDDLVRIVYRPKRLKDVPQEAPQGKAGAAPAKGSTRRGRTSISMDPDLYETFVLIEGDARTARHKLRQWATDADSSRTGRTEMTGVSRMVHKQMLAAIREVVEAGLTVIRQHGGAPVVGKTGAKAGAPAAEGDDVGAAWDDFKDSKAAPSAKQRKKEKKAKGERNGEVKDTRAAAAVPDESGDTGGEFTLGSIARGPTVTTRPGTGLDGLDPSAGLIVLGDVGPDLQARSEAASPPSGEVVEWTRVRDDDVHADPFMG